MALAANSASGIFSWQNFTKAEDLKKRIIFTILALIVYRFGTFVPLPGINPQALADVFNQNRAGIIGLFDLFAGGALSRMTVFALNVVPYISAAIIMQLMSAFVPRIDQLKKEGERGRSVINQYTRYLTVVLAASQAFGIAFALESAQSAFGPVAVASGALFRLSTIVSLVGGTLFLVWLGEEITRRGIGNGISLIIFSGIVASLPGAIASIFELGRTGSLSVVAILTFLMLAVITITFIVFMERAHRKILVTYPKRQVGNRVSGGESSHLPMKLNAAGVIPPIFATSILFLPISVANINASQASSPEWLIAINALIGRGQPLYLLIFASLIIFFAFFYTAIVFNPKDTAENLQKYGGIVPGIRPGQATANYLDFILTRLTVVGSLYLTVVSILPEILIARFAIPFYFGGTSLLIVVAVTMDTVQQIQSHLFAQHYEKLMKRANF